MLQTRNGPKIFQTRLRELDYSHSELMRLDLVRRGQGYPKTFSSGHEQCHKSVQQQLRDTLRISQMIMNLSNSFDRSEFLLQRNFNASDSTVCFGLYISGVITPSSLS